MAVTTTLNEIPAEGGTIVITVAFTDEDGSAEIPKTLTKTLTNSSGTVINGMDATACTGLAASMVFVLSGADLALADNDRVRHFLLEGTYDSTNGTDLPIKVEAVFSVQNLIGI